MGIQKIILAADHAGFSMKEKIKAYLKANDIVFEDLSIEFLESDDYPDIAFKAAKKAAKEKALGVLVCGSGTGMCICANKVKGIRAAMCYDEKSARFARQHNDTNILCLAGREIDKNTNIKILKAWLTSSFLEGRHARRVDQITAFEKEQ